MLQHRVLPALLQRTIPRACWKQPRTEAPSTLNPQHKSPVNRRPGPHCYAQGGLFAGGDSD